MGLTSEIEQCILVLLKLYTRKQAAEKLTDCLTLLIQQSKIEYFDNKLEAKNARVCRLLWRFLGEEFLSLPRESVLKAFIFLKNLFCVLKCSFSIKSVKAHNA